MKFTRELPGTLAVRSVAPNGIRVLDKIYNSSIALTPDEVLYNWHETPVEKLTEKDFEQILGTSPEIVVLGTGSAHIFPDRELMFAFARKGIGFEVMDTAAAARTFNVLANEERRVVAVLYLG